MDRQQNLVCDAERNKSGECPGQFVRSPFFFHAWSRFDDSPASVQRRIQARWKSNDMTLARDAVIYQMLLPCVRTDRSQGARVKRKKKTSVACHKSNKMGNENVTQSA